jgi:hypothetical protein
MEYDFKVGDKVYWNDPGVGVGNGFYEIARIDTDEQIDEDTIILITNEAGGEAEVYATELCKDGIRWVANNAQLIISEDALYIRTLNDVPDNEVVMWNVDEVKDEPELAFTIANAVAYLYAHGVEAFAETIGKEVLEDGSVRIEAE